MARWYVTVSIPYVNAAPHLGYALELVEADAIARHHRQIGDDVRFLGGTDDHAIKNAVAAAAAGLDTAAFVDENAARFETLARPLDISFDDFIRTSTDPRHRAGVDRLWRQTAANGDFYLRHYEGHYCIGCEQFYAADDLVDECCPEHETPVEWVAEENWFFRLSRYQDQIVDLLESGRLRIVPEAFANEAIAFVRGGLDDISVSRSTERARGWGIRVPDDHDHVIYVWWEALTNYITALGYGAPDGPADDYLRWWVESDERVHVIGKGILRFHAVYWPALLLSVGAPLPTALFVHPYLTVNGRKLSKSTGNVIEPVDLVERHGVDAVRWWLVADVPRAADADFTEERLLHRYDDDLANGIGNLTSRVVTMLHRFRGGRVPETAGGVGGDPAVASAAYDSFDLRAVVEALRSTVADGNRLIESTEPWALARAERDREAGAAAKLDTVLSQLLATLEKLASEVAPLLPDTARRLREQLTADERGLLPPSTPLHPRRS